MSNMKMQDYGIKTPKLNRVLITGGMLSGKTTLAAKFATDPRRVVFVSTDGNALGQGYRGIQFEFPQQAVGMKRNLIEVIDILRKYEDSFDVIVFDLIEDFDESMQSLLSEELDNFKTSLKAWGKITGLYRDLQSLLRTNFQNKTVILVSREEKQEVKNGRGEVVKTTYEAVLRDTLKNRILKDVDADIRVYIDDDGNRRTEISSLRYPETEEELWGYINKPIVEPKAEPTLEERIEALMLSAERRATELNGKATKLTAAQRKEIFRSQTFEEATDYIKVWASNNVKKDEDVKLEEKNDA